MTNNQVSMTNQENALPVARAYNLAERTAVYGEEVIHFCRGIRRDAVITPLIRQLVRSATSVGANYVETDEAGSKKKFTYRISVRRREARETQYWLRMIVAANSELKDQARTLWRESKELVLILAAIHRKAAIPTK
jgi:four helix bundle protein